MDGEFKQAYFGRLVRFILYPPFRPAPCHHNATTGRGRYSPDPHQDFRREETGLFWEYEHGSGDIIADGEPDAGKSFVTMMRTTARAVWCGQAAPGKLMYDPFIGTGSMAYVRTLWLENMCITRRREQTTAYFGAHVYGSDIDGRQMRGKG